MSPTQIVALGPELLPLAREYTNDLNEAHFLVHQVVTRLVKDTRGDIEPVGFHEARKLMATVASTM